MFATIRDVMEVVYFGSGIIVAIAALFGLRQLRLAKDAVRAAKDQIAVGIAAVEVAKRDLQIRSKREAVALAADRCEKFGEHLIPRRNKNMETIAAQGVTLVDWEVAEPSLSETAL